MNTVLKNGEAVSINSLKVDDEIDVMTLFGWARLRVKELDVNTQYGVAYAKNGKFAVYLKGEEGFWESSVSFNPEAIAKVQFV